MTKRRVVLLALSMCLLCIVALSQGLYTESKVKGGPLGDNGILTRTYFMPKMFRSENDRDSKAMIFRLDKQMVYEVDASDKTYSEMTFEQFEATMKKMNSKMEAKMAELKKNMANMPPEQRKMMEQMMAGQALGTDKSAKVDVVKSDEKKEIAGYSSTKYTVTEDGKETISLWATKDIKSFNSMKKDFEEYTKRFVASTNQSMKSLATAFQKVDGFPMQMTFTNGISQEVQKVEQQSVPSSQFEVPEGYTKVKSRLQEAGEKSND